MKNQGVKKLESVFTIELDKIEADYLKHEERHERKEEMKNFIQPTLNLDNVEELVVIGKKIVRDNSNESIETLCLDKVEQRTLKEKSPQKLLFTETLDLENVEK